MAFKAALLATSILALAACATPQTAAVTPESLPAPAPVEGPAVAHPALWPAAHSPAAIKDAASEAAIDALIARMTVEQKVGQLIQADISTITPADLATYPLGSILAGGNSGPNGNERSSAADWNRLVRQFRAASRVPAANGVAVPVLFGVDAVHGHNNLPGATVFPHNIGLGATHDPALLEKVGAVAAAEISASGIEWTFAPGVMVPQDLRWGRSYEGFSGNPADVARDGAAMVTGLQGTLVAGRPLAADKVAATAKHFLADGGTHNGKDQGDALVSEADLIAKHVAGYKAAIDAGALTVMASFSSWNGVKNHGNKSLLTDVLKDRMGFDGLVVGDWNGHGQVDGCTVTRCPQAINAGVDLIMAPDSWKGLYASTLEDAKSGAIPAARLDDAVRRVLRVKAKLGLLDGSRVDRLDPSELGSAAHRAVARQAVAESLVLLKNNGSVLPIKPGAKVLVAGAGADDMAMQNGGWTISWQGSDVTKADFPGRKTIFGALAEAVGAAGGKATLSADGTSAAKPDVAIVVFGEKPYAEFLGDVPTLDYQPEGAKDLALIRSLKARGVPVVSVFLSGRPLFTNPEINASDAFVAAWLPGTEAEGIADVLVAGRDGKAPRDFAGRLSFPWPADARSPVTAPQFASGYGLSYAAPANVPVLSEDPGMDVTAALNVENFFVGGQAAAPWALKIGDAGGERSGAGSTATSPLGNLVMRPVDLGAQENARSFTWSGPAALSIDGPTADLSRQLNNAFALRLDLRRDGTGVVPATRLALGNVAVDATALLSALTPGQTVTVKIPLRCFADYGADLKAVGNALRIEGTAGLALTLRQAKVEAVGEPLACPAKAP